MILHALDAGAGPSVALLHGLFGRAQNFGGLSRRLSQHHRVITLDLRNHGASPHDPLMTYASMAEDVRETLIECGAWPACVLGHSMGGKVAMMLALLHPDAVQTLIVADIAPVAYDHANAVIAAAMQRFELTPGLTRAAADAALANSVAEPAVRSFLLQNLMFSEKPHWRIGLSHIAAALPDIESWPASAQGLSYGGPACFISGSRSDFVMPGHRPSILRHFPAARFVEIADAGHWLHADQPETFAVAVEKMLK